MSTVQIKDKRFRISLPEAEIKARIKELAQQISKDMEGKNPLFLGVLNGSFIFAADLMREMTIPCEMSFVKLAPFFIRAAYSLGLAPPGILPFWPFA